MSDSEKIMLDSATAENLEWSLLPNSNANVTTDNCSSLGVNENDNLPRFKINAPGPTALASSIFQQNNMVIDETNEQSFVVLDQSYLESIRETSLASYMDIQQKSAINNDVCSISTMSPSEKEENLKKLLEENAKLKETLKQNNSTMKQQLNTITVWQKEVMTVCDKHKQKFLETKELINQLKVENNDLKEKISKSQATSDSKNITVEEVKKSILTNSITYKSMEDIPAFPNISTESLTKQNHQSTQEQEFMKKIGELSEELKKANSKNIETQQSLKELENCYNRELDTSIQKSDPPNFAELQKLISTCCEKDMEILHLKEIVTTLQQQIQKLEESTFSFTDLQIESTNDEHEEKQKLEENVKFYNHMMTELGKSFSSQCEHYFKVQKCLKESIDAIQMFENASTDVNPEDEIKSLKNKLCEYRKMLVEERLQSIDDKKTIIKVQQKFQQIFSDYNSIVFELELFRDENEKLKTMQTKMVEENSQKVAENEKYLDEQRLILEKEKSNLLEEKLGLQMDRKSIIEEKERLESECSFVMIEKKKLSEERTNLLEERTSLDLQSKLYEAEEGTLQKEKKSLQKKCDLLTNQMDNLNDQLRKANGTIKDLRLDNIRLRENEELIAAYKIQTEEREKQFEEMRSAQRNLQDQLQALSMANLQLRGENNSSEEHQPEPSHPVYRPRYCSMCAKYISPEEHHGPGICTPDFD